MYPMRDKVKRPYRSTRRREQASETRRRIIRAAHDLFVSQGYGRTTIAEVARAAGVAVETVYAAFRNKPTLLREVWYATLRGDEQDIRLLDRPEMRAVLAEPDLATRLRAPAATGLLGVSEQECSDVLAATMEGALWYRLVEERGWSEERFAQVLGTMWVAALVRRP